MFTLAQINVCDDTQHNDIQHFNTEDNNNNVSLNITFVNYGCKNFITLGRELEMI
jgi:hypothetical protein